MNPEIGMINEKISKGDVYRKYVFDETSKDINRKEEDIKNREQKLKDLGQYADSLNDHEAEKLCCDLSHSRRNPVYGFIRRGPDHFLVGDIKTSHIYMIGINGKVNQYLSANGWSLKECSKDKHIYKHKEFKKNGDIHPRSTTLIAQKIDQSRFRLVDGNHRGIKLCINGAIKIKLIYY